MSYILHLGHQPTDLGYSATNLRTTVDTSSTYVKYGSDPIFDSDLDVNAIMVEHSISSTSIVCSHTSATSDTTWYSFQYKTPEVFWEHDNGANGAAKWCEFYDSNNNLIAAVRPYFDGSVEQQEFEAVVYGDTTVTSGGDGYFPGTSSFTWWDIKVTVNASNITLTYYADGGEIGTATAANTLGNADKSVKMIFKPDYMNGRIGVSPFTQIFGYFSHMAVTDNVTTIGRRFIRQTPTAAGTHTDFTGPVSALADGSLNTRMISDTAGQRQSFTLTGPTIPATAISSVTIIQNSSHTGTGPTQSAGFVKVGVTNYDGTAETVPEIVGKVITTFENNPSDSNPWDNTTLPSEYGIVTST